MFEVLKLADLNLSRTDFLAVFVYPSFVGNLEQNPHPQIWLQIDCGYTEGFLIMRVSPSILETSYDFQ